ncbi:MAG: hypothetical protein KGL39_40015, partial [Patescibacteria group bacterium]|nr:hypothetical protein [Patescibacteria group bacterium]
MSAQTAGQLTKREIAARVKAVVSNGHWMIRADNNGISHGGFRWAPVGVWTEAPDWNPLPICGGGLHGQSKKHGGLGNAGRLVFCEYDPRDVVELNKKIKVRRARILMVNQLPAGLKVGGSLDLRGTQITTLPADLKVG